MKRLYEIQCGYVYGADYGNTPGQVFRRMIRKSKSQLYHLGFLARFRDVTVKRGQWFYQDPLALRKSH